LRDSSHIYIYITINVSFVAAKLQVIISECVQLAGFIARNSNCCRLKAIHVTGRGGL
jgi:hypothetical protein